MNRQFILLIIALPFFCILGCQSPGTNVEPSRQMSAIVEKHRLGPWNLGTKGLPTATESDLPDTTKSFVEVYDLLIQPGSNDTFRYRVMLDKSKGTYWIIKSGGLAGRTDFFGPGR